MKRRGLDKLHPLQWHRWHQDSSRSGPFPGQEVAGGGTAAEPWRARGELGGQWVPREMVSTSSSWMGSSSALCTACVMSVSSWHSVSKR